MPRGEYAQSSRSVFWFSAHLKRSPTESWLICSPLPTSAMGSRSSRSASPDLSTNCNYTRLANRRCNICARRPTTRIVESVQAATYHFRRDSSPWWGGGDRPWGSSPRGGEALQRRRRHSLTGQGFQHRWWSGGCLLAAVFGGSGLCVKDSKPGCVVEDGKM